MLALYLSLLGSEEDRASFTQLYAAYPLERPLPAPAGVCGCALPHTDRNRAFILCFGLASLLLSGILTLAVAATLLLSRRSAPGSGY